MPQNAGPHCWPHEFRVGDALCQNRNWKNYAYLECWDESGAAPRGEESVAVGYARGPWPGHFYTPPGPDSESSVLLSRSHELPVGHKIVFDWDFFERGKPVDSSKRLPFPMVCGVPEPGVIACRTVQKDAAYGFVLSPHGSWVF
ncbi:hypothetical protein HMPREF9336_01824 [Segniliparus rugosus ATCC BAA-974]|uniref:Uncharacterized protein n=2 Tax=Segniliparus rugosus TaxID=286804 RepID=E5XQQ2_SEGRC|nr:hypothetical protein HMPREF9336_01824 [Segniliparus rugosus ATCC BAA-974]